MRSLLLDAVANVYRDFLTSCFSIWTTTFYQCLEYYTPLAQWKNGASDEVRRKVTFYRARGWAFSYAALRFAVLTCV